MSDDLRRIVESRLESEGLRQKPWSRLVLAALDGQPALQAALAGGTAVLPAPSVKAGSVRSGAYLSSLTVQGFRGIGPKQTLTFTPVRASRSSSAATDRENRASPKPWKCCSPATASAGPTARRSGRRDGATFIRRIPPRSRRSVLLEGQGSVSVACTWDAGRGPRRRQAHVQPKGKTQDDVAGARMAQGAGVVSAVSFLQRARLDAGRGAVEAVRRVVAGARSRGSGHRAGGAREEPPRRSGRWTRPMRRARRSSSC